MSNFNLLRRTAAALVAAGALAAGAAHAQSVAFHSVSGGAANWTFAGAAQQVVPGTTTLAFAKFANQRMLLTFSAECAVQAPAGNTSAWLDVDIVILNAAGAVVLTSAPTSGNLDAFCSSNGSGAMDGWATQSVTANIPVAFPAGVYRAQVRARLNNGATQGWLGERSLTVWR